MALCLNATNESFQFCVFALAQRPETQGKLSEIILLPDGELKIDLIAMFYPMMT